MTKKELIEFLDKLKDDDQVVLVVGQTDGDDIEVDDGDQFEIFDTGYLPKLEQVIYIRKI